MQTTRQTWQGVIAIAVLSLGIGCGGTTGGGGGGQNDTADPPETDVVLPPTNDAQLDSAQNTDIQNEDAEPDDGGPLDEVDEETEGGDADVASDPDAIEPGDAEPEISPEDVSDVDEDGEITSDADAVEDTAETEDGENDDGPPQQCTEDADCVASAPCIAATCDETGTCVEETVEDGEACEDGNACSIGDQCEAGLCLGQFPLLCDDDNLCTDDLCNPASGCQYKPNFAGCDDGNPCTHDDSCQAGVCFGPITTCDDGNACTEDLCEESTGNCINTVNDALACTDGSECTEGDACLSGVCVPGAIDGCEDGQPCTEDLCQGGVCTNNIVINIPCSDGDACTSPDLCQLEGCVPGPVSSCNDDNPCTIDTCDQTDGCQHSIQPNVGCEDGDACTIAEVCSAEAVCEPTQTLDCEDENPCTDDACDPASGCVYTDNTLPCDDSDACTGDDTCAGGGCVGVVVDCDDDDACSLDTCDSLSGCETVSIANTCDDHNPCTDDSCDSAEGCINAPNSAPCDDEDPCTTTDTCQESACAGTAETCDDGFPCTWDVCDHEEGCINEPMSGPCDDGDPCTEDEACEEDAECDDGAAVDVDDGIDCTIDACETDVGITHTPDDAACSVGQGCVLETDCTFGDVRLLITKFSLVPTSGDTTDGFGQWFSVANIGEITIDLRDLQVGNGTEQSVGVVAYSKDPEEALLLEPGITRAGHKDAAPGQGPFDTSGFSFVFGEPGDGFAFAPAGGAIILRLDGAAYDTLDTSAVTTGPDLAGNAMPLIPGVATELDVAALGQADDHTDNDIPGQWCAWAEGSAGPEGVQLECSRARLNEVALASGEGERFVEIHMPAGGSLNGYVVQFVDGDGVVQGTLAAPSQRTPIGAYGVIVDGQDGTLPVVTDGSCQLFRVGNLIDVYGFGTLDATTDENYGKALFEGTPGPAQVAGQSAARAQSGFDTDDNGADWVQETEPTPGLAPTL